MTARVLVVVFVVIETCRTDRYHLRRTLHRTEYS